MKILLVMVLLVTACTTSAPYIIKQSVDEMGKKTEMVCTHKNYLIPWHIGVAAGFFTFKGDLVCKEKVVSER